MSTVPIRVVIIALIMVITIVRTMLTYPLDIIHD